MSTIRLSLTGAGLSGIYTRESYDDNLEGLYQTVPEALASVEQLYIICGVAGFIELGYLEQ